MCSLPGWGCAARHAGEERAEHGGQTGGEHLLVRVVRVAVLLAEHLHHYKHEDVVNEAEDERVQHEHPHVPRRRDGRLGQTLGYLLNDPHVKTLLKHTEV